MGIDQDEKAEPVSRINRMQAMPAINWLPELKIKRLKGLPWFNPGYGRDGYPHDQGADRAK